MIRTLQNAAIALLVSGSAAFAADLPVPDPIDNLRICQLTSSGTTSYFYYIPGTETCLALHGFARAEMHYVGGDVARFFGGTSNSDFNNWTTRARGDINLDARTATDIGQLRTYVDFYFTVGPDNFDVNYDDTDLELEYAYIELAGDHGTFTAGMTDSFFDFFGGDTFGTRLDIDDPTEETTLFAYSLTTSSGWRGTLSIEDPSSSGRRLNGADDYEGQKAPDVVGSLKYTGSNFSGQVMAMARQINDDNGDGFGWAAGAGFQVSKIASIFGFSTQATYADGAIGYVTTDPGGIGDIEGPNGNDTNQAWGIRAGLTAQFTSQVLSWLDGSFTRVENHSGSYNYDLWSIVGGASWTDPKQVLTVGPEFAYEHLDGDDPGKNGSVWGAMLRVQGSF